MYVVYLKYGEVYYIYSGNLHTKKKKKKKAVSKTKGLELRIESDGEN